MPLAPRMSRALRAVSSHPRLVAVLRNAQALLGLRHRRIGDLNALVGSLQAGVGAAHFEPDGGIGSLLIEFRALHQVAGFGDACFVRRSVEQIPAEGNRDRKST